MGGELPLERPAALELVAGCDDPETHGVRITVADPSMNNVVLVIQRVLVFVIHLQPCSCVVLKPSLQTKFDFEVCFYFSSLIYRCKN
jgi:hypothetical protein